MPNKLIKIQEESMNIYYTFPSGPVISVSIASLVVPLTGLTIDLSLPANEFRMLLFPTLGFPIIAIEGILFSSSSTVCSST